MGGPPQTLLQGSSCSLGGAGWSAVGEIEDVGIQRSLLGRDVG